MPRRPLFLVCLMVVIVCALYVLCHSAGPPGLSECMNGENIKISGTIEKIEEKNNKNILYLKRVSFENFNNPYNKNGIICYLCDGEELPRIGTKVLCEGNVKHFENATNPGEFDFKKYYLSIGYNMSLSDTHILGKSVSYSHMKDCIYRFRLRQEIIIDSIMNKNDGSIIKAMLLGNKNDMDKEMKALYQKNGIAHILAISGLHVSIIGLYLYSFLGKIGVNKYVKIAVTIIILVIYDILTGNSLGMFRAAFMLILRLIADLFKRTYDVLTAIMLAAAISCIINPYVLYNGGFFLSYMAVFAAAVYSKYLVVKDNEKKDKSILYNLKKYILDAFTVGLSVNLITLPVICNLYFEIPIYSWILNLIVIPFMSILLVFALLAVIAGNISFDYGQILALPCHYILGMYEKLCVCFSKLPYSVVVTGKKNFVILFFYYLLCFIYILLEYICIYNERKIKASNNKKILCIYKNKTSLKFSICLMMLVLLMIRIPETNITMLSVGQGDGFCIIDGKYTCMVDGGSSTKSKIGENVILPFLKSNGISSIDYWIITHPDVDHSNGLIEILSSENELINIKCIILPCAESIYEDALEIINLAKQNNIQILFFSKGDEIVFNNTKMQCINPIHNYSCDDANEYSLVMYTTINNTRILFTGDATIESENQYLSKVPSKVEILKVAHHGSNSSSSDKLLEVLEPEVALISVGKNNVYGHPHKEIIERLNNHKSLILRTDEKGAVIIKIGNKKYKIISFR